MSTNAALGQINEQQRNTVDQIKAAERLKSSEINSAVKERITNLELVKADKLSQMENQYDSVSSQISELESVLGKLPAEHPEKKKIEDRLKMLRKARENIRSSISSFKSNIKAQLNMLNYQKRSQLEMVTINFARQKSMVLKQYAEKIMQVNQQIAMQKMLRNANSPASTKQGGQKNEAGAGTG